MDDMYNVFPEYIGSLEELESWKSKFDAMPEEYRIASNDIAVEKYGKNNIEMYDKIKGEILMGTDPRIDLREDGSSELYLASGFELDFDNRLLQIRDAESQGLVIMILEPESMDDNIEYTNLDLIQKKWEKFQSLDQEHRELSDQMAMNILGINNYNLYIRYLNHYLSYIDDNRDNPTDDYSVDIEDITDPVVAPYFRPEELNDTNSSEVEEGSYEWCRKLSDLSALIESSHGEKKEALKEEILSLGWNPEIPFTVEAASKTWLRYGISVCAECVDMTASYINEAQIPATEDIPEKYTSEYLKNKIVPVFVCLSQGEKFHSKAIRWFTGSEWSHAAIGFDSSLEPLYSYNVKMKNFKLDDGFSIEGLKALKKNNTKIKVYALFVTPEQKDLMEEAVQWYIDNKDNTHYNFGNIFRIATRRVRNVKDKDNMICSQFVYSILCLVNFKMSKNKDSAHVSPGDLDDLANDARFYVVYTGNSSDYKKRVVDKICYDLLPALPLYLYGIDESTGSEIRRIKSAIGKSPQHKLFEIANLMLNEK